jgi:hypothetical protein
MRTSVAALGALALALSVAGAANASTVFDVTVWSGAPNGVDSSTTADLAHTPTGLFDAHFTYTGPLDWSNLAAQNSGASGNLVKDFISVTDQGQISSFSSQSGLTLSSWLNTSLSQAGDANASFFRIIGTYTAASAISYTIRHDDGASVYDSNNNALYLSPAETSAITGSFTLPTGVNRTFTIDYVEGNGSPSVLNVQSIVPEPATWAMFLMGFGILGAGLRHRRSLTRGALA